MTNDLNIREYHRSDDLTAWTFRGTGERLVVVFSGIGKVDQDTQPFQFARTATAQGRHSVLYLSDTSRSWLNGPGLIEQVQDLVTHVADSFGATKIATLGHSMGGFSAAVMAGPLGADNAVCLSPQNSIHPDVADDDPRWRVFRDQIRDFRVRDVAEYLSDAVLYTVLFGRHGREAPQRDRFPIADNIDFFVMRNTVHNTPMRLKNEGILSAFVEAAANGRRRKVRQLMDAHFGTRPLRERTEEQSL